MEFIKKYQKIFIAVGFLLVTVITGYLLYSLFIKPIIGPDETEPVEQTDQTKSPDGFPSAQEGQGNIISTTTERQPLSTDRLNDIGSQASEIAMGGVTQTTAITKGNTTNATLAENGTDIKYYDSGDGKFYQTDKNGNRTELSDQIFHTVQKVTWSPDNSKAILEYPDGANIVYDFNTKKQITLPSHWKDFGFSPDGNKIVLKSIGRDVNNRWLAVANNDGSKIQPIEALGDNEAHVYPSWSPNNQVVAMYAEGKNFNQQDVYFFGLNNENFKSIVVEGRGFIPKWTPEGDRLIYSVYSSENNMNPNLWIVNAEGETIGSGRKNLNLQTWADKCTFGEGNDLYCAVPKSLPEGSGLFRELANGISDTLYKIDLNTGLKKMIAVPEGDYTMKNLMVTDNGYYLYFVDQNTGQANKIKLK